MLSNPERMHRDVRGYQQDYKNYYGHSWEAHIILKRPPWRALPPLALAPLPPLPPPLYNDHCCALLLFFNCRSFDP